MGKNVRSLAFDAVMGATERGEFLKAAVHRTIEGNPCLTKQDRAFLNRLANGVTERKLELDYVIGMFSRTPVAKMRPAVRTILRMGVYQILYMQRVPASAACNESVRLAKQKGFVSLSGFVNGVLRNVLRNRDAIEYPNKSVKYSVPEWLLALWQEEWGDAVTEAMLDAFLKDAPLTVRGNVEKVGKEALRQALREAGVGVEDGYYHPDALRLTGVEDVKSLPGYREGWFAVQDESSMLVTKCAGIREGWRVLDACAAPGGKALHAAQALKGSGKVWACDVSDIKMTLIHDNIQRLGCHNVEAVRWDALQTREEWVGQMDLVLADLPCSGLGVIGKKSDIKYRVKPEDLSLLQERQRKMLANLSRYVKEGGVLVYSTCTIQKGENEENAEWIRDNLPYRAESLEPYLPQSLWGETTNRGYLQLLPGVHSCDGFFLARFRKHGGGDGR